MKKMHVTPRSLLMASLLALSLGCPALGVAADKEREVKPNDTLGHIVAEEYPGHGNYTAIMQAILKASPGAFIGQDINRLIVGKPLKLPDANDIPGLKAPAPVVSGGGGDPALLEKLKVLEAGRVQLEEDLKVLEDENASLQEMVKSYEEAKQTKDAELTKLEARVKELEGMLAAQGQKPDSANTTEGRESNTGSELAVLKANVASLQTENTGLKDQLDKTRQSLDENQQQTETLQVQLADIKRLNKQLNDDLQQAQAARESQTSSNWLPWTLLGLLAVLMLPLLWLLRRHREEPLVTTVAAPFKPDPVTTPPSVQLGEPQAYSDTTPPPMPVAPDVEEDAGAGPEDSEAELKLDIARAYLDLRDSEAAAEILQEVLQEGGKRQKREAREILSFIA